MATRRDFLRVGAMGGTALALAGCSGVARTMLENQETDVFVAPPHPDNSRIRRFLNRAGYGPRPGDIQIVSENGYENYVEQQLYPEDIDDTPGDLMVRHLSLYHMDEGQLLNYDHKDIIEETIRATLVRALYSKRHLHEAMVEFWSDHFNIYIRTDKHQPRLKLLDDRDVIRPNTLGLFPDLLAASAQSPAMLYYLDNNENYAEEPNENYARELMELHTLGIDSGYTQQDVEELARILTGWGIESEGRKEGHFAFFASLHDSTEKTLLGQIFPAGRGEAEIHEALSLLSSHPSTAHFIARKLVQRFVSDVPPELLVSAVADEFLSSEGDIRSMLRLIFLSEEFATAPPRLKRPFTFVMSALRALNADASGSGLREVGEALWRMGHLPFHWPMPDGYPDRAGPWMNSLLHRWNFCFGLMDGTFENVSVDLEHFIDEAGVTTTAEAVDLFVNMILPEDYRTKVTEHIMSHWGDTPLEEIHLPYTVGMILAGPGFQWM